MKLSMICIFLHQDSRVSMSHKNEKHQNRPSQHPAKSSINLIHIMLQASTQNYLKHPKHSPGDVPSYKSEQSVRSKTAISRTKRFDIETSSHRDSQLVFRDMCLSENTFERVDRGFNDGHREVEILPNTWIWVTRCVRPESRCPAVGKLILITDCQDRM